MRAARPADAGEPGYPGKPHKKAGGIFSESKWMDLLTVRAWLARRGAGCTDRYASMSTIGVDHTVVAVPDEDGDIALVPRCTLQETDYVQTKTNKEDDILVVVHNPFREANMEKFAYWRAMFAEILAAARADAASRLVMASCINCRTRSPVLVMCVLMHRKRGQLFPAEAKKRVNDAMGDKRNKAAKVKQCDYYCDRNGEFTEMLFCMHLYTATSDIRCTYPQKPRVLSKFLCHCYGHDYIHLKSNPGKGHPRASSATTLAELVQRYNSWDIEAGAAVETKLPHPLPSAGDVRADATETRPAVPSGSGGGSGSRARCGRRREFALGATTSIRG